MTDIDMEREHFNPNRQVFSAQTEYDRYLILNLTVIFSSKGYIMSVLLKTFICFSQQ